MKKLAASVAAAILITCSQVHAASKISVAVAPSFANAANDIVGAFQAYYFTTHGLTYNVSLIIKSAPQLEADIIAGGSSTGPYDLFLSSGLKEVLDLKLNHSALLAGNPFAYATDLLDLYSTTIDVTGGLPFPLTTDFVIADPAQDVYGRAAAEVLLSPPWSISPSSIPGGHVFTKPDTGTALATINLGLFAYGFVGKSQICQLSSGVETYPDGSYHHEYQPLSSSHPYIPIVMAGVEIALTRTADQQTELGDFIAFLTGTADSFGNTNASGTTIIQNDCFALPPS
jgi:molybdate transport system substrate-binding protein